MKDKFIIYLRTPSYIYKPYHMKNMLQNPYKRTDSSIWEAFLHHYISLSSQRWDNRKADIPLHHVVLGSASESFTQNLLLRGFTIATSISSLFFIGTSSSWLVYLYKPLTHHLHHTIRAKSIFPLATLLLQGITRQPAQVSQLVSQSGQYNSPTLDLS